MKTEIANKPLLERLVVKTNNSLQSQIISASHCSFQETELSFYKGFKHYCLFDTSFSPVAKYQLLDNGDKTIHLDGSIDAWIMANIIEPPQLAITNILEYTKLVFGSLLIDNVKSSLVTSVDDVDFCSIPTPEILKQIESAIKPPVISFRDNTFNILTCLLHGKNLFDTLIQINTVGNIDITDKNLLIENVPTPEVTWDQIL